MLLRTGLSIHVQFGEFRAEGTFILSAWQPVSVALLNAAVEADDGNSAFRRHVTGLTDLAHPVGVDCPRRNYWWEFSRRCR
jgi:hypothetical protein